MSRPQPASLSDLPLHLLAMIMSFITSSTDLATINRTSRLLRYMSLPQLWRDVRLSIISCWTDECACSGCVRSCEIARRTHRIIQDFDTPFPDAYIRPHLSALQTLMTKDVAGVVQHLSLLERRSPDANGIAYPHIRPEEEVYLNMAVKAVLDRAKRTRSFKWDIATRLLPSVYLGLQGLPHLEFLHIRTTATRGRLRGYKVPILPNLRALTITDMQYPNHLDDFSTTMLHATKLVSLTLHSGEFAGVPLEASLLHELIDEKRRLKLRTLSLHNCGYGIVEALFNAIDFSGIERLTLSYSFDRNPSNHDLDFLAGKVQPKSFRTADLTPGLVLKLEEWTNLDSLYLVSPKPVPTPNGDEVGLGPFNPRFQSELQLRDPCMNALCKTSRSSLKHLLLPAGWPLPVNTIARLIRACPNITQLGFSMECTNMETVRHLVPFLEQLWAVRLLSPIDVWNAGEESRERRASFAAFVCSDHEKSLSTELATGDFPRLTYIGIGPKIYHIGGVRETDSVQGRDGDDSVKKCKVTRLSLEDVQDIEIWKMDTLEIVEEDESAFGAKR